MTDVTADEDQEPPLPAADEQLLRGADRAGPAGGLKLTGEGGLLGKLTKMVTEDALGVRDSHRPTTPETSTANTTDIGQEALY